jgi:diguanylate cyclase (GGDEF)-like protein/PAS domain S-box-containing protein
VNGFSDPLADHGSWEHDLSSLDIRWSDGVYRIHGVSPDSFHPVYGEVRKLVHPDDLEDYREAVRDAVASKAPFAVQHRIIRPDGSVRTLLVRGAYLEDPDGGTGRLVGTTQDVTGRQGADERLWHLANHDPLTGLFNRRRFMEELNREIAVARRSGEPAAVLMLDLDRFKEINDSLGHMVGDSVLPRVAEAMRSRLRTTDTLARLGGDEFALVLPACPEPNARVVAEELLVALAETSVQIGGRERPVSASIGIAPFGPTDENRAADEVLVEADLAMYRAKSRGPGGFEVFDEEMRAELAKRLEVEAQLRGAIADGDLEVYYQPVTSITHGTVVACEALLRWHHPVRGMVMPDEFVPVAEGCGLIGEIGAWVLDRACRQAAEWRKAGRNLAVSVNVSPQQLAHDDVARLVAASLERYRLPGPLLTLEITETSLLHDASPLVPALHAVRELGVRIAMDDFGGGSSSLGLLRLLPLDVIKIDRMFVEGIPDRPEDRAIVAAVLSMAEELGLSVIAEGVERERQHWELKELGCEFGQGFLYAKPAPPKDLALDGYSGAVQPGVGDPSVIREFMRQIGIPARVGA